MDKFFEHWMNNIRNWRIKSCCCLAPLRIGLLIIGYANVLIAVTLIVGTASQSVVPTIQQVQASVFEDEGSSSLGILAPSAQLAFTVLLLCGVHRNDVKLLQVYVYYGLAEIVLSIIVYSIVFAAISVLYIIFIAFNLCYEAYIILLVRSLIIDIRRQPITNDTIFKDEPLNVAAAKNTVNNLEKSLVNAEENVKVDIVNENVVLEKKNETKVQETNDNNHKVDSITIDIHKKEDSAQSPSKGDTNDVKSKTTETKLQTAINDKETPTQTKSRIISAKITNLPITKRTITSNKTKETKQSKIDPKPIEESLKPNTADEIKTNNLKEEKLNKMDSKTIDKRLKLSNNNTKAGESSKTDTKAAKVDTLEVINEIKTEEQSKTIPNDSGTLDTRTEPTKDDEISKSVEDQKETIPNNKRWFWKKTLKK